MTGSEQKAIRADAEQRLAELRPVWHRLRRGDIEDSMVLAELSSVLSQIKAAQAVLEAAENEETKGTDGMSEATARRRWAFTDSGRLIEAELTVTDELELSLGRCVTKRGGVRVHAAAEADQVLADRLAEVEEARNDIRARHHHEEDE